MEYTLSKQEAISEMQKGNKITHVCFTEDEWITIENDKIVDENGYKASKEEFWRYRYLEIWETNYALFKN